MRFLFGSLPIRPRVKIAKRSSNVIKLPDKGLTSKAIMKAIPKWKLIVAVIAMIVAVITRSAFSAEVLSFPPTSFEILNPDTGATIGRATYRVDSTREGAIVRGENGYFDGQTDVEIAHLVGGAPGQGPRLVDFDHTFYNPDRSILRRHHLDLKSGAATCIDNSGGQKSEQADVIHVPDNTWAGASVLIPIQGFLRAGNQEMTFPLNVFSCASSPRIFAVTVNRDPGSAVWTSYGGEALRIEAQPDFGWLNLMIAAFVPKFHAWFDPHDGWAFLGDESARFYKGPPIMLVKSRASSSNASRSAN
jgi:hypothetical protein